MSDDPMAVCCRNLANSQHIIETKNAEIAALKEAIRRLAEQDATNYSEKPNSSPTLTDEEREAVRFCSVVLDMGERPDCAATLRKLLERLGESNVLRDRGLRK